MKAPSLLVAVPAVALIALTIPPPAGTRYATLSSPPNPDVIRALARSHLSMVTDLFWIRAIGVSTVQKLPADGLSLIAWCNFVTDLDAKFLWPYVLGGLLGPIATGETVYNVPEANLLLRRGVSELPHEYRLAVYLSYNQLHLQRDLKAAAETLRVGALAPQAPAFLGQLATRLLAQTNSFEAAFEFVDQLERSATSPEERSFFERRRREIERDQRLLVLQQAVDGFKVARGVLPKDLRELIDAGQLPAIPEEPLGGTWLLDGAGKVRSTSGARLEAHVQEGVP